MDIPATAEGFLAEVSALHSLEGKDGVTFHTSLPEDRCVRLLVKNLGRWMPESAVREELESLGIHVQGVMHPRSGRRDRDPSKDRPPTPNFIVSVPRGPEVSRVRSLTGLCGLRVSVESYVPSKGRLQFRRCQCFGHTHRNCGHSPRCVACGGPHISADCPVPRGQPLSAAAAGVTTSRAIEAVLSERRRGLRLRGGSLNAAIGRTPRASQLPRKLGRQSPLLSRRALARGGATSSVEGVLSRLLPRLPRNPPPNQSQSLTSSPK
jgi:hypothetical protein